MDDEREIFLIGGRCGPMSASQTHTLAWLPDACFRGRSRADFSVLRREDKRAVIAAVHPGLQLIDRLFKQYGSITQKLTDGATLLFPCHNTRWPTASGMLWEPLRSIARLNRPRRRVGSEHASATVRNPHYGVAVRRAGTFGGPTVGAAAFRSEAGCVL